MSIHPLAVHRSWPTGRVKDYVALSSSPHYALHAQRVLISRLKRYDICHPSIRILQSSHRDVGRTSQDDTACSWIVLPFHPALVPLVSVVARTAAHFQHLGRAYGQHSISMFRPRISWSQGDLNLMQVLAKHHKPIIGR